MPVYEYKGLTGGGKTVNGIVDAETVKSARARLRKQGVFATDVREQTERASPRAGRAPRPSPTGRPAPEKAAPKAKLSLSTEVDLGRYFQRITIDDMATATRQLSTLFSAGIPIVDSLGALADQVENERLKVVLSDVKENVNEGASLAEALRPHRKVFTDLYVNMVAAGEQSGALDAVLSKLADYTEGQVKLRGKLVGALTYPVVMVGLSFFILGFLMTVVVPKFSKLFEDLDATLPLVTRILLGASGVFASYWWLILAGLGLVAWGLRKWAVTEGGRKTLDRGALRLPIFGKLLRMVAVSRFASTLSTLLAAGVPILGAMAIARNVVENSVIAEVIEQARGSVSEGQSIAVPLRRSGEFPPMVTHMIAIGEKTGELEMMLQKVATSYENQVERTVDALTSLLEPILILVMGGMVGFIAVAVLWPMLSLNQMIH